MKTPHAIEKEEDKVPVVRTPPVPDKPDAPKVAPKAEEKPANFVPKFESKDDHVAHIAEIARHMQKTQPGVETAADQILHHVAAIQDPETHNKAVAESQRLAAEAQARRAKELGRPLPGDKAKVS